LTLNYHNSGDSGCAGKGLAKGTYRVHRAFGLHTLRRASKNRYNWATAGFTIKNILSLVSGIGPVVHTSRQRLAQILDILNHRVLPLLEQRIHLEKLASKLACAYTRQP
jgi:hypothetical protein